MAPCLLILSPAVLLAGLKRVLAKLADWLGLRRRGGVTQMPAPNPPAIEIKIPGQCILWRQPDIVGRPIREHFDLIDTYGEESHWWRCLLKCRECGQLYFFEFTEEIDREDGDDPQYSTYIPVETEDQIAQLKKASTFELLGFFPRLQKDFSKGAKSPTRRWVVR